MLRLWAQLVAALYGRVTKEKEKPHAPIHEARQQHGFSTL
jgi:hypothetical protein